ncbi:putative bifunctional diguanylate cyclase/phosphodiesterase [Undibacterium squillarum]|uniref:putative bifunctional diguanylate cyclase/phosphodiesterase n=1 Tax=Undibacterium squillarum TaxID=1131567 RepID=UPI00167AA91E|nr:GGDEF domain-containing phosphodiesterase [Undibacterium squillarum]
METQSFILLSLAVDVVLIAALLLPWLHERKESHALFWAAGQAALTANTALLFIGSDPRARAVESALLLTISVSSFLLGTGKFIRQRVISRRIMLAIAAFGLLLQGIYFAFPAIIQHATALLTGATFLVSGILIVKFTRRYPVLSTLLVIRGIINLLTAKGWMPENMTLWFMESFTIKTLSMLCLIYAVIERIRDRYKYTIDSFGSGLIILDGHARVQMVNERAASLIGKSNTRTARDQHVSEVFARPHGASLSAFLQRITENQTPGTLTDEITVTAADGRSIPLEVIVSPYYEREERFYLLQLIDISERKEKEGLLYKVAHFDDLTGLLNRHGFLRALSALMQVASQPGDVSVVILMDLDKYKRVYDSYGHVYAEQLLKQIAADLNQHIPAHAILARFGGDEFAIGITGISAAQTAALAQNVAAALAASLAAGFTVQHHHHYLTASIGIASAPELQANVDGLIQNAYLAMYDAKKAGKGQIRTFSPEMLGLPREAILDSALRHALHTDELYLLYQPIVDVQSGEIRKFEALIRWSSKTLGQVPPDQFIPIAEDSDLILEIGEWVIATACAQFAEWNSRFAIGHCVMSINISAAQLKDSRFAAKLQSVLQQHGLQPSQIELELTERVLIDDGDYVRRSLNELNQLGVRISLDDFGTGYSALSYLTKFQIHTLKIDRSFVMRLTENDKLQQLVSSIIMMGQKLGMSLVAEGVETPYQARTLSAMGCDFLQGYLISKPIAAQDMPAFVLSHTGRQTS